MNRAIGDTYALARRLAREWLARNNGPPTLDRRITARLLDAATTHGADLDAGLVETIARETLQRYAAGEDADDPDLVRARAMVRTWRSGTPTTTTLRDTLHDIRARNRGSAT